MLRLPACSIRLLVLSTLVAALGLPRPALAFDEPVDFAHHNGLGLDAGSTLLWRQTMTAEPPDNHPGEIIVVAPGTDADPAAFYTFHGTTFDPVGDGPETIETFAGGTTIESATSAAPWGANHFLVTDPVAGRVWKVGTSTVSAALTTFAGNPDQLGDAALCWPMAVTSYSLSAGLEAWYAEGSFADHLPDWEEFGGLDCADSAGGVHRRSNSIFASDLELEPGTGPGQVPVGATVGLAVAETGGLPELLVVAGQPSTAAPPRILRKQVASVDSTEVELANWYLPPDGDDSDPWNLIGNPAYVAAVNEDRMAVGGRGGLKLYHRDGSFLQDLWLPGEVEPHLTQNCDALLGLAADPEGESLYAMFGCVGGTRLLGRWDTSELTLMGGDLYCVGPGLTDGGCEQNSGGCPWACDTIGEALDNAPAGSTIRVEPGEYPETLKLQGRKLRLEALEPGTARVIGGGDGPVLYLSFTGLDPVEVDGFVFEGGTGLPVLDQLGEWHQMGGGLLVVGSSLVLSRSVLHHNSADRGGGLAAVLSPMLELKNVGLVRNSATDVGGGLAVAVPGLYGWTHLILKNVTVADNGASRGGSVYVHELGARLELTILDAPETKSLCTSNYAEMGLDGADYSSLWPETEWEIWDLHADTSVSIPAELLGDGYDNVDCAFVDRENMDYHLKDDSACKDVHASLDDHDTTDADMGMYGGLEGDWDWDRPDPGDDDDSSGDDDDTADDDDVVTDDDDGDDDDSAVTGLLPSGLRCDCDASAAGGAPGLGLLLLGLLALRRGR